MRGPVNGYLFFSEPLPRSVFLMQWTSLGAIPCMLAIRRAEERERPLDPWLARALAENSLAILEAWIGTCDDARPTPVPDGSPELGTGR